MKFAVNGVTTYAAIGGRDFDPALPALVFLHGAGFDHSIWQQQTRYFAHHGYSVLALDLPGHGRSDGAPPPDIKSLADWVAAAIAAAGLEKAVLIGHSMGALGALETAARHPGRVRALALLGVAARMPVHPDLLAAAAANDHKAIELIVGWAHGARAHRGGNIASGIWLLQTGARQLEQAGPGVLSGDLVASDAYDGALSAAARLRCPTLFLLGAQDRMSPPRAAKPLCDAVKNASRIVLPDAGHMMMVEAPGTTLDALRGFLDGIAP